MAQIKVDTNAENSIDALKIQKALNKIASKLSKEQIERLSSLADSPKAIEYLSSDIKFSILKKFL